MNDLVSIIIKCDSYSERKNVYLTIYADYHFVCVCVYVYMSGCLAE